LQRASEDAQAEVNREQQEVFNSVGSKLMTVIDKFAKDNGYAIVLDISSPQTPVLYAINEVNITSQVIELYDKQYPQQAAASAAAGSAVAKPPQ
jgi:outer membrane protein